MLYYIALLGITTVQAGEARRIPLNDGSQIPVIARGISRDPRMIPPHVDDIKTGLTSLPFFLKTQNGANCNIPQLDPFSKEIMKYVSTKPKVKCSGINWVTCKFNQCTIKPVILKKFANVTCKLRDILYIHDHYNRYGKKTTLKGSDKYILRNSDHVTVSCSGIKTNNNRTKNWSGVATGFRYVPYPRNQFPTKKLLNVLILAFDATSRNGFIRKMPKSWKVLNDELGANVLYGFNTVGEGTIEALLPLFTGKIERELPNFVKKERYYKKAAKPTIDPGIFIFHKLKPYGYRTAYLENFVKLNEGTFQWKFTGFTRQPADHYVRPLLQKAWLKGLKKNKSFESSLELELCMTGETPQYKQMLDLTEQFMQQDAEYRNSKLVGDVGRNQKCFLEAEKGTFGIPAQTTVMPSLGKWFIFTFIADISHDVFDYISTSDEDLVEFLRKFRSSPGSHDTLLVVMGDHGNRYEKLRSTYQGRVEEKLPLLAILLPKKLKQYRPNAETNLKQNSQVITTVHDLHATLLDVMDVRELWNEYKVPGADLKRGLTLLEPIPRSRSCREAGISAHYCACLKWRNIKDTNPMYRRVPVAVFKYINRLLRPVRKQCAKRNLVSIEWVKKLPGFNGYFPELEVYQAKFVLDPAGGEYEATVQYNAKENKFNLSSSDISRTNRYGSQPDCIVGIRPELKKFCYCKTFKL